ncbi:hypothetical protein CTAYLR_006307 [Chrysophaeum taylorii]|uniref:Amino acid transporter transmembrane domain-containing protein n=1 Tax=Chrysophaeum taylorii TaxID=2483200 RepID=A0AAD7U9W3_9STRA|nr:hypothetical protein CTAYLR_006307 [Chrysophaeum taylorii]
MDDELLVPPENEAAAGGAENGDSRLRRASWPATCLNFMCVTWGAIQLPYAFGQMGWTYGIIGLCLSSISTWVSARMIGEIVLECGAGSYPEVGRAAFGEHGARAIVVLQWLSYFLTGVVQLAYSGATYQQTLPSVPLCEEGWMLASAVLLGPCALVPSFREATILSFGVVLAQALGLGVFFGQIADNGQYKKVCYSQVTTSSALAALSNIAFAYGGHGVLPELAREMSNPKELFKAVDAGYAFMAPSYAATGALGFYAFGNAASSNFSENLRRTPWLEAYLWITSITTVPLLVVGQIVLFLNVELAWGILPTDTWRNSNLRLGAEDRKGIVGLPPVLVRFAFRGCYVVAMYVAARALVGAGLGPLTDIAGALGIAALTYWVPFILHCKVFWSRYSRLGIAFVALNVAFGLVVSVTGCYYAFRDLFRESVTFFNESNCREGADFWGDFLWDHPLDEHSKAYKTVVVDCCQRGHGCGN